MNCEICNNIFNETSRLPHFLIDCQDTICSECLNKKIACPKCNIPITSEPKVNKQVLLMVENNSNRNVIFIV